MLLWVIAPLLKLGQSGNKASDKFNNNDAIFDRKLQA